MKLCKKCGVLKPLSNFCKAGKYLQASCKACLLEYNREYRKNNKDKIRFIQAKSKLGINKADFDRINKIISCEICGEFNKPLHIDHSHSSLKFRGALCNNCNHGIGKFKDDIELLEKAISYLRRYQ